MSRPFSIFLVLLLIAAGVAIGVGAYNAGYSNGLAASGHVEVVRTVQRGWGSFPFGLFIVPLFFLLFFGFGRRFRNGPYGWNGHGHRHDGYARFEERSRQWHRAEHERETDTPATT